MYGVESGKPDKPNQVLNHLRFLQRAMDVTLVPESKKQVFVAGMHSLSFRGFLNREVSAQSAWSFAESIDTDAEDKLSIDRSLSFSGWIAAVGYMQKQEGANVDSIVVGIEHPVIDANIGDYQAEASQSDELFRIHRLHLPVLAIESWDIKRQPVDDVHIM